MRSLTARGELAIWKWVAAGSLPLAMLLPPALPAEVEMRVLPSLVEEILAPGQRVVRTMQLSNRGSKTVPVAMSLSDWTMDREGRVQFAEPGSTPGSCAAMVTLIPNRILVPAGATASVVLILEAPHPSSGRFRGTRWGAILYQLPQLESSREGETVRVSPRLSTTLYVTAAGSLPSKLTILSVAADAPRGSDPGSSSGKLRVKAVLSNAGETPTRFSAVWTFLGADGNVVETLERRNQVALPDSVRELEASPQRTLAPGAYTISLRIRPEQGSELSASTKSVLPAPERKSL